MSSLTDHLIICILTLFMNASVTTAGVPVAVTVKDLKQEEQRYGDCGYPSIAVEGRWRGKET